MTINEYLDGVRKLNFQSKDGVNLADTMADSMEIWCNNSCIGYCILALERAGQNREQIKEVLKKLHGAFDDMSVDEAKQYYQNYL